MSSGHLSASKRLQPGSMREQPSQILSTIRRLIILTREAIVVTICQLVINEHWHSVILLLQALLHNGNLLLRDLQTGPAVPLEGRGLGQATQSADQATGGHGEVIATIIRSLDGDWKPIGDEEQPSLTLEGGVLKGRHAVGIGGAPTQIVRCKYVQMY